MKKAISISITCLLLIATACSILIKGKITDQKDGRAIKDATVLIPGYDKVFTGSGGDYLVKIKKSQMNKAEMQVSAQGYLSNKRIVDRKVIDVALSKSHPKDSAPTDYTPQLTQLICTGNKPIIQSAEEKKIGDETKSEPNMDGVYIPCKYETWSKVDKYEDIVSLNPLNDVIWAGSVVQGQNLMQGLPSSIGLPRNPLTITLSGLNYNDQRSNSLTVENPSKATIDDGVRKIMQGRNPVSTTGQFSYVVQQAYSYEHALMNLRLSAKWGWGEFSSQLNSKNFQTKNTFVVKLIQNYYSITCPSPSSAGNVFKSTTTPSQLSQYVNPQNPPCLITNVNYGRIFLLSISSSESSEKIGAALNAAFSGWGVNGKVNFSGETAKIFNDSEVSIFSIGGSAKKVAEVIAGQDKVSGLMNYIRECADWSYECPGAAIGYKAVFLCDNSVAAVNSTTQYQIRRCSPVSYKKPFNIRVKEWKIRDVTDDDEDMNFGYKITFFNQQGNMLAGKECRNNKGSTYVEEPGKVGWREGKNRFFLNESVFTITDPAIFRIKIEIRVNTEDGDCDRPWKDNPLWSREIDVASLPAGQQSISPWDSMEFIFETN